MRLAAYGTSAVVEYGTNDIFASFATAAATEANITNIVTAAHQLGLSPVCVATLLPRVTSTDNMQTATNQLTITTGGSINPEAERVAYNTWVRGGAAGSGADCTIDTTVNVEVNASNVLTQNGGRWKAGSTLDSGTASAGATTTLTDSAKTWTVNQYVGDCVLITGGTGVGQVRGIWSNTATVLTVDGASAFSTAPDATSTYQIYSCPSTDGIHPSSVLVPSLASTVPIARFTQ